MVEHDMDRELATHARIESDASKATHGASGHAGPSAAGPSRRAFLWGAAGATAGVALLNSREALARTAPNLAAQPPAGFVPLSALAGLLVVVCWNMAEKEEFLRLLRDWRGALVLLTTFVLTLVENLTVGIVAGCVLAALFAVLGRAVPEEGN